MELNHYQEYFFLFGLAPIVQGHTVIISGPRSRGCLLDASSIAGGAMDKYSRYCKSDVNGSF